MAFLLYILSIVSILIPGAAITLGLKPAIKDSFLFLSISFFCGLALTAIWMTILGIFSLPWNLPLIAMPICSIGIFILIRNRHRLRLDIGKRQLLFVLLTLPIIVPLIIRSLTGTISHWDFMLHWAAKSKSYFLQHALDIQYLQWPWHQHIKPDYPHLITNIFTYQALWMGQFHDRMMMLNDAIYTAAMFYVVYYILNNSPLQKFIRIIMYCSFSILFTSIVFNMRIVGGADILFAALVAYILFFLEQYFNNNSFAQLETAYVLLGVLSFTKYEGLFYSGVITALITITIIKRRQDVKNMLRPLACYTIIITPWLLFTALHHFNTQIQSQLSGAEIITKMGLLGPILQEMLNNFSKPTWYGAWILIALLYTYLILKKHTIRYLSISVILLMMYLAIYLTNADPIYYIQSSLARLLLPIFILCMYDCMNGCMHLMRIRARSH